MNFKRLAVGVNTAPLLTKIAQHPGLWEPGRQRSEYPGSAHAAADAILLRGPAEITPKAFFRELEQVDYEAAHTLMPEVAQITNNVYDRVGFVRYTGRSMITRLPPGGRIQPHVDEGLYADVYDRFHVCLDAEGTVFRCGSEGAEMRPGEIWWFNHKRTHEVLNCGARARIHLILDLDTVAYKELRGMTYQAEQLSDLWEELGPLLQAHWREVALFQDDIELDPDIETYAAIEASGELRTYTARDRGRLVGYAIFFVRLNHHYAGSLQAWQDVLFLAPDYRRGMAGATLIRVAETRLRAEGVQVVYHRAKRSNQVGELLEALGYTGVEQTYAKRLDKKKGA